MRRLFFRMRADERLDSKYHLDAMRHEFLTDEESGDDDSEGERDNRMKCDPPGNEKDANTDADADADAGG